MTGHDLLLGILITPSRMLDLDIDDLESGSCDFSFVEITWSSGE